MEAIYTIYTGCIKKIHNNKTRWLGPKVLGSQNVTIVEKQCLNKLMIIEIAKKTGFLQFFVNNS